MTIINGVVKKGKKRGSALGYPTANIPLSDSTISGIFAVSVLFDEQTYSGAAFADPQRGILEVHILNFHGELYDREISVHVLKKMRDVSVFTDDEVLKAQIAKDVKDVAQYFASIA